MNWITLFDSHQLIHYFTYWFIVNFDVSIIAVTCYSNKPVMQLDSFPFPIKTKYLFYYNFTEKSIFFSWKRKLSDLWFWEKIGQLTWKEILWRDINCNFKRVNSLHLYRKVFLATLKSSYFFSLLRYLCMTVIDWLKYYYWSGNTWSWWYLTWSTTDGHLATCHNSNMANRPVKKYGK